MERKLNQRDCPDNHKTSKVNAFIERRDVGFELRVLSDVAQNCCMLLLSLDDCSGKGWRRRKGGTDKSVLCVFAEKRGRSRAEMTRETLKATTDAIWTMLWERMATTATTARNSLPGRKRDASKVSELQRSQAEGDGKVELRGDGLR